MANGSFKEFILVGNLSAEPESSVLPNGTTVTYVRVASTDGKRTDFTRVTLFGRLGEVAAQYLKKGQKVLLRGTWKHDSYERNGMKHYVIEFIGYQMEMLSRGNGKHGDEDNGSEEYQPELPF